MNVAELVNTNQINANQNNESSKMQNELDQDAFFKLLITQLKSQDPLEPMENREFISQMASFTSLEQMQQMNENMQDFLGLKNLSEGAALIGKTVEKVEEMENGEQDIIEGVVDKVVFEDDNSFVVLAEDKGKFELSEIDKIY